MARRRARIVVSAGTNGAGKTSIVGGFVAAHDAPYFNPDAMARKLVQQGKPLEEANAIAWKYGFEGLQRAIDLGRNFRFETTLGGNSIIRELHRAIDAGLDVRVFYVGLASPQMHIARVAARVAQGGHDIPATKIRERYLKSLSNLIGLIGKPAWIHIFDNSVETPSGVPAPQLVMRVKGTNILEPDLSALLTQTPQWAKPVVAAALQRCIAPVRRKGNRSSG